MPRYGNYRFEIPIYFQRWGVYRGYQGGLQDGSNADYRYFWMWLCVLVGFRLFSDGSTLRDLCTRARLGLEGQRSHGGSGDGQGQVLITLNGPMRPSRAL